MENLFLLCGFGPCNCKWVQLLRAHAEFKSALTGTALGSGVHAPRPHCTEDREPYFFPLYCHPLGLAEISQVKCENK